MTQPHVLIARAAGAMAAVTLALLAFLLAADPSSPRASDFMTRRSIARSAVSRPRRARAHARRILFSPSSAGRFAYR